MRERPRSIAVSPATGRSVRGPGFVLSWAAAGLSLLFVAVVLAQFAILAMNQRALVLAARRGALEATLPRATPQSVAQAARRSLAGHPQLASAVQTLTRINGRPQQGFRELEVARGDQLTVRLAAHATAAAPDWLRWAGLSLEGRWIEAAANCRQP